MKRMLSSLLAALLLAMAALPVCAEEGHVQQLLNAMSLRDKVSQMLMVDFRYWDQEVPLNEKGEIDEKRQTRLTAMNEQVEDVLSTHRFGAVIYFAQNLM